MVGDETASQRNPSEEAVEEHLPITPDADAQPDAQASAAQGGQEPLLSEMSIEQLQAQLAQAQQKLTEQRDSVLRAQAELQNVRRRAERDVEHAHKFALEKFSADLLPVVDSLERALQVAGSEQSDLIKAMHEGVELTLKMLLDAMARYGVEQLNPVGEPFDPQKHQAMSMQPSAELPANSVLAVLQKGYSLNGRLVRPAMVIVSASA